MAKTQTIDVNTLSKDITIKSSSKNNVLYLKGLTQAELAGKLTGDNSHNDLTITLTSGHKIILKDYFAKNGKFPIKTLKVDDASYNLVSYVNSIDIRGLAQRKGPGVTKKLNGTVFDDLFFSGSRNGEVISTLGGNDVINAGSNNATLIGGTGTNTFNYEYDNWDDTSFGKDTIKLTKGETLNLNITYNDNFEYDPNNETPSIPMPYSGTAALHFKKGTGKNANDLIITNDINNKDSITIKNYYGKATGATVLINGKDLSKETLDFLSFDKTRITSSNLKTSALADVIDVSDLTEQPQKTVKNKKGKRVSVPTSLNINSGAGNDTITGSKYNDIINAGDGNDTIIGGLGNDTITGGKGENTINIDLSDGKFGNDVVKLTKGEIVNLNITNAAVDAQISAKPNGKNYVVTVYGSKASEYEAYEKVVTCYSIETNALTYEQEYFKGETNVYRFNESTSAYDTLVSTLDSHKVTQEEYVQYLNNGGVATSENSFNYTEFYVLKDGVRTLYGHTAPEQSYWADDNDIIPDKNNVLGTVTFSGLAKKDITKGVKINGNIVITEFDDNNISKNKLTGTALNDEIDASLAEQQYKKVKKKQVKTVLNIDAGNGNDTVTGSAFDDVIKGGAGNDIIMGGKGNDKLYGDNGNNAFVFNAGDGKDTVYSGKGKDTIVFNDEIKADNIKFARSGKSDLIVKYNHNEQGVAQDTITIKNYYDKKGKKIVSSVKNIEADGHTYNLEFLKNNLDKIIINNTNEILGTDNNDLIIGSGSENQQVIYAGGGNDTIYGANNTGTNKIYAQEGNNVIYSSNNTGGSHVDVIYTGTGNDTIYGGDGARLEIDLREGGNNVVYLGKRNSSYGNDVYLGAGNDTIYMSSDSTKSSNAAIFRITGNDVLNGGHDVFYWNGSAGLQDEMFDFNINYDELVFTKKLGSNDLVIMYGDNNDITIKDYFKAGNEYMATSMCLDTNDLDYWKEFGSAIEDKGGIKTLINGTEGTDNNDYIIGTNEDEETINAGAGNDIINPKGGTDIINLGSGNNIVFAGTGNKTINGSLSENNIIYLGSGTNTVSLGVGEDKVYSGSGANTIEFSDEDDLGDDVYTYGNGNDTLHFKLESLANLTIDLRDDDIILKRGSLESSRTVTLKEVSSLNSINIKDKDNNETALTNLNTVVGDDETDEGQNIKTGDGYDLIHTGLGNDKIEAGKGYNFIYLGLAEAENNNTYKYTLEANDRFVLPESITDFSKFTLQKYDKDLIIGYNNDISKNTVTISGYYDNESMGSSIEFRAGDVTKTIVQLISDKGVTVPIDGTNDNDTLGDSNETQRQYILGYGGNDTITGGSGNDYLNGGSGNDSITGGSGNDTYEISRTDWGDDLDIINDSNGTDTLKIGTEDNVYLFFNVSLKKDGGGNIIWNGNNAVYNALSGNLCINSDNEFTLDNAQNYKGVVIQNYFVNTGKIENIKKFKVDSDDMIDAFDSRLIDVTAQSVANWLAMYSEYYSSVSDVITNGTDIRKAELLKLFQPIYSDESYIYGTNDNEIIFGKKVEENQRIYAYDGDDVIFSSENATYNRIYAGSGNDIIYTTGKSDNEYIYTGEGDDIVYGADEARLNINLVGGGNNTVYLGKRNYWGNSIEMGNGNDTIYMSTDATSYQNGNAGIFYITYNPTVSGYNGGHDTFHWRGAYTGYQHEMMCFSVKDEDIFFTKAAGSDDLVIRYGFNNDVTYADYFKEGNDEFRQAICYDTANTEWANFNEIMESKLITSVITGTGALNGTDGKDYIKGTPDSETPLTMNGGDGDDIYSLISTAGDVTITDSAGNDSLYLSSNLTNTTLYFNVKNDGTFAEGENKLQIISGSTVTINNFNSIEKITTKDWYSTNTSKLNVLKTDVVAWLSKDGIGGVGGNGVANYTDVADAMLNGDSTVKEGLTSLFNRDANWQAIS